MRRLLEWHVYIEAVTLLIYIAFLDVADDTDNRGVRVTAAPTAENKP